jgi:hypothetical protein
VIKEVTEQEFWTFFGIIISARALGRKGDTWDRHEWQDDGILPKANFDEHMNECRFEATDQEARSLHLCRTGRAGRGSMVDDVLSSQTAQ